MAGSYGLQTFIYSYITGEYSYSQMILSGLREDFVNLTKGYTTGDLGFGLYVFDSVQKDLLSLRNLRRVKSSSR
jgi:hypothetical protein